MKVPSYTALLVNSRDVIQRNPFSNASSAATTGGRLVDGTKDCNAHCTKILYMAQMQQEQSINPGIMEQWDAQRTNTTICT